ncbi:ComEC/Rec2 family competence protein [uncultured Cohaesibacter sp.]|uniref:ComEC/Rec2 family competence protein n=1 Tax=uncultured Cohaesibacter sp. TaxID=1002546 RepID=UPI0029301AA0|nr:ComEC/Rec2 family competence protein [uncultured Cohaesibacter sp.]
MAKSEKEKGVKARFEANNSSQIDEKAFPVVRSSSQGASQPLPLLAFPFKKPTAVVRARFVMESLFCRLHENWSADCEKQNARFLWVTLGLASGAAAYYSLPDEPNFWLLLLLCVAIGGWIFRRARAGQAVFALMLLGAGLLGLTAASFHGTFQASPILKRSFSSDITGQLERIEYRGSAAKPEERWTVRVERISRLSSDTMPRKLLLLRKSVDGAFHVGERLKMHAFLTELQEPVYPGGFDYGRYLWARSIGGQGYLARGIERLPTSSNAPFSRAVHWWGDRVEQARGDIAHYIRNRIDGEAGGLAVALAVGKRDFLSRDVQDDLRRSGLAHILAISGLHMALVAMSVFWLTRKAFGFIPGLVLHYPTKQWAALLSLVFATGYLVLSGSSVATVRAFVMTAIFLVSILVGRPAFTMHNLALALVFLVLIQPYGVVEAGMQMSFAATAALIACYDRIRIRSQMGVPLLDRADRSLFGVIAKGMYSIGGGLLGIGLTSVIASLAVLPFSVAHFQQMAPLGLIANLVAMPVLSLVVMPVGLVSLILSIFGLQSVPLLIVQTGLETIIETARLVSDASNPAYLVVKAGGPFLPFSILALGVFTIHRRYLAKAAIIPLGLAFIIWWSGPQADLWISQKGTMVAYRDQEGTWQSLGSRHMTLEFQSLIRSEGDMRVLGGKSLANKVKDDRSAVPIETVCDGEACYASGLLQAGGEQTTLSLAIVRKASAFAEECQRRAILVSKLPIPKSCEAPLLTIGKDELKQRGALFVKFKRDNQKGVGLRPDADRRGEFALVAGPTLEEGLEGRKRPEVVRQSGWRLETKTALPVGQRPWMRSDRLD